MGAVNLEKDTYKSGINALVLFHAMFGYVNEDALVVSRSFASKMCSYSIIDLCMDVKNTEIIKWIAPIGSKVKSKESVVKTYKVIELDKANQVIQGQLGSMFGAGKNLSEYTIANDLIVPNNIDEAYVSDVLIQENVNPKVKGGVKLPDRTLAYMAKDLVKGYQDKLEESRKKEIYSRLPDYVAADRLRPIVLDDASPKLVYKVRVRLIKRTDLLVGSKITNRFGGKGVISKILPDDEMPVMIDDSTGEKRVVEVVMNPYSTVNRKIPGVNMEQLLSKIAYRIHDLVESYKTSKIKQKEILPLLEKYYPGRFNGKTVEEVIEMHNNSKIEDMYYFNVGSYSLKYTPQLLDEWANELGVKPQSRILIPTKTVADLKELKDALGEEEYLKVTKDMEGKYTEIDKPLNCGPLTLLQLYHIPSYSNKVTSSMFGVDVNEWKDSPIMGRGRYRVTGQIVGEMELTALLARGAKGFIESARGDTSIVDNQTFLNHLLGLGLTITDSKGYNQGGSALKDRVNEMKVKFRLKNQK